MGIKSEVMANWRRSLKLHTMFLTTAGSSSSNKLTFNLVSVNPDWVLNATWLFLVKSSWKSKVQPHPGCVALCSGYVTAHQIVVCTDVKSQIIRLDASLFNEAEIIQQRKRGFCLNCTAHFEEIPNESTLCNCSTFHTAQHITHCTHPRWTYLEVL